MNPARVDSWYKSRSPLTRHWHGRIMAVKGSTVDRYIRKCETQDQLVAAVERAIKATRKAGPFLVEHYHHGERVLVRMEG